LLNFFPLLKKYGDLNTYENFYRLLDDVCTFVELNPVPWDHVNLNRDELISSCVDYSLIEIFRVIYEARSRIENARFWCCKSMANVQFHDPLESSGLKPFYIYLYRDGRDVALSFQKAMVGEKHIYNLAKKWRNDQLAALSLCETLPEDRYIKVRYEELINNSDKTIKAICNKLGIPFQKNYSAFYTSKESINTSDSGEMWENVKKPVLTDNFNKFKKGMSQNDICIFESVAGDVLQKLNYSLENKKETLFNSFSENEIETFNLINNQLKKEVQLNAKKEDIEKRSKQNAFFNTIKV